MNYLCFLFLALLGSQQKQSESKYIILVNRSAVLTPIPSKIESFWADSIYFDSITIQGESMTKKIKTEVDKLKRLKQGSIVYSTFSVSNAIIRYSDGFPVDTLYTDKYFNFWKRDNVIYEGKKTEIKKWICWLR